ncbi:hypothetical protein [Streptomyces sp. NBC_01233]|uniref:hypothetical protein n=1 Tax=Streptomyces sp. NBC_01233 TaxID=2903787 RepID=UPI002E11BFE2|nr:hypothetical protein OG332_25805 [Streptomyces sp. NBC_01233]
MLDTADEEYRSGTEVEVRTARGKAYELSGSAVFNFSTATGLLLVPFLTLASWLFSCARHGRVEEGELYFLAAMAGLFAAMVLGALAGTLVGIGTFIF